MKNEYPNLCPWTLGLAAAGLIHLSLPLHAEEAQHQVLTALSSTTLSGYVDTSAIWAVGRGAPGVGHVLPGRVFDGSAKQDGFNLDMVKIQLARPVEEGQWSAGYTVGLLYGPDANVVGSASSLGTPTDFAVKDAHVILRAPVGGGLDLRLGVWSTIMGYEVIETGANPNFSRSFGFYIEPLVHTGALLTYKVNDLVTVNAAIADRGDLNTINARSGIESLKTYLGSIVFTAPESAGFLKGATATFAVCDGGITASSVGKTTSGEKDVLNYYAGATLPTPISGLSVGVAYDYRANGLFDDSYENVVGGYLLYQASEKLKLSHRLEYATGSSGAFGVTAGAFLPGSTDDTTRVRLLGNTTTVDYSLWGPAVITRLEFRWDHSLTGQGLYNDGNDRNALSLALNVIFNF